MIAAVQVPWKEPMAEECRPQHFDTEGDARFFYSSLRLFFVLQVHGYEDVHDLPAFCFICIHWACSCFFFCNLLIYSFDSFVVDKVQCLSVPIAGLISLETK